MQRTTSPIELSSRLIESLGIRSSLFHMGQYCGQWQASTQGRHRASFHLILHGECFLHRPGQPVCALREGDAVFLLRDINHRITPDKAGSSTACNTMQPLEQTNRVGTGLACGFFELGGQTAELLTASLPACLIFERDGIAMQGARPVFELLLKEAYDQQAPASALIERLTELLFLYLLRAAADDSDQPRGVLALAQEPRFAPLLESLLENPQQEWTLEEMAAQVHLSRAAFCKQFSELCGLPPARFLQLLRMSIAAGRLRNGASVSDTAAQVGYHSIAAFSRVFRNVLGVTPGEYRRQPGMQIKTNEQKMLTH